MAERFTIQGIIRLHNSGGVLNAKPSIEPKLLMEDTPEAQEFASVWQSYLDAKDRLQAQIQKAQNVTLSL